MASGKRAIVFRRQDAFDPDDPFDLPCGRCIGCRLERARQWAIRCMHESMLYDDNVFVTLTYNDENLPAHGSLDKRAFPLFMKRLRARLDKYTKRDDEGRIIDPGVRVFYCGEYGDENFRPHYHAILFNCDFEDKVPWKRNERGDMLYRSSLLEALWPYGHSSLGAVTFESCGYVARYTLKKKHGPQASRYTVVCPETGEIIFEREPEFGDMSRFPGIGRPWIERFGDHTLSHDFIVMNGKKLRPPKYYDAYLEKIAPEVMKRVRRRRTQILGENKDGTLSRLRVREEVKKSQIKQLSRNAV